METAPLHTPKNNSMVLLFVGIVIVAIVSMVVAVVLPRRTTEDRSRASTNLALCAHAFEVPLSACNQKCGSNTDCTGGMICYRATGTTGDGLCRMSTNPTNTTCTNPTSTPVACVNGKVDIMLVLDRSSTMNQTETDGRKKLEWAKAAANGFIDAMAAATNGNSNVRIGIASFGAQGNDGTGVLAVDRNSTLHSPLSSDLNAVKTALVGVRYIQSGTCIECGLRIANTTLSASTAPTKIVILLSDGKANHIWNGTTSNAKPAAIVAAGAGKTSGYGYYVVGYGIADQIDEVTLKAIATDASHYVYKPEISGWASAFKQIAGQICPGAPTPTPAPQACRTCNYQLDVVWGPVLNSFSGGTQIYSYPVNRLIGGSKSDRNSTANPACPLVTPPKQIAVTVPTLSSSCADPVTKGYLTATWDTSAIATTGYASATVKNTTTGCTYNLNIVSYKADWSKVTTTDPNGLAVQNLFDQKPGVISPGQTLKMSVKVPTVTGAASCYATG